MKMEQTECSETLAYKIHTPGKYPDESIQHSEQGECFKSRILDIFVVVSFFFFNNCFSETIAVPPSVVNPGPSLTDLVLTTGLALSDGPRYGGTFHSSTVNDGNSHLSKG